MPGDTAILGEGGNGDRERRIARLLVGGRMLRRRRRRGLLLSRLLSDRA